MVSISVLNILPSTPFSDSTRLQSLSTRGLSWRGLQLLYSTLLNVRKRGEAHWVGCIVGYRRVVGCRTRQPWGPWVKAVHVVVVWR